MNGKNIEVFAVSSFSGESDDLKKLIEKVDNLPFDIYLIVEHVNYYDFLDKDKFCSKVNNLLSSGKNLNNGIYQIDLDAVDYITEDILKLRYNSDYDITGAFSVDHICKYPFFKRGVGLTQNSLPLEPIKSYPDTNFRAVGIHTPILYITDRICQLYPDVRWTGEYNGHCVSKGWDLCYYLHLDDLGYNIGVSREFSVEHGIKKII